MAAQMGDPAMADMNITRMDAAESGTREEDVRTAAYTLPFLTPRRMVILNNPVNLMRSESGRRKFIQTLSKLPESTAMLLVQDDTWIPSGTQRGWKNLYEYKDHGKIKIHPLLEWARGAGGMVKIEIFRLPALNAMPGWINSEVKRQGGRMTPQAASVLAGVEGGGLLEEQYAISLYGMIVRQYRLIQMAKEARANGITSDEAVGRLLGTAPFPAQKALNQARRYSFENLNQIYHRLLEIDRMSKTSQMDLEVALQAFVVEMGRS